MPEECLPPSYSGNRLHNEDKNVRLVDFGTFEVKQRAERMGHNPKTGEKLKIEAKKIVTFKQGKALGEQFIVKPKQKSKAKKKA